MDVVAVASAFVFGYPVIMAYIWIVGGVYFHLHRERGQQPVEQPPALSTYPLVSVLVPCHNEGPNVVETLAAALESSYPNLEIIAVNDGSTDSTAEILDDLAAREPRLRVLHLAGNQGKGVALRTAALAARSDFLVCVDGDALLDEYAVHWMVFHLSTGARVGAVTGNPRIRNRGSLLGKLQTGEFSSIIGLIKRAHRTYGRVFTVSGVIVAFRRTALDDVGYWDPAAITDDIDISWRLQMRHWDIRYEPRALCAILMPETLRGLWKQRLRWAHGGVQVLRSHLPQLLQWRRRRLWPLALESVLSLTWAATLGALTAWSLLRCGVALVSDQPVPRWEPTWYTVALASTCLVQFAVSLVIDRQFDRGMWRSYFWIIWYPLAFWLIGWLTCLTALPSMLRRRTARAVWVSPDRGLQPAPSAAPAPVGAPMPVAEESSAPARAVAPRRDQRPMYGRTPTRATALVRQPRRSWNASSG